MSNKFLEQYPKLREADIGDIIESIINSLYAVYKKGDVGKIIRLIPGNRYLVDFKNQNNSSTVGDGIWSMSRENFKIIKYHE